MFLNLFPSYVYQAPARAPGIKSLNQELLDESYKIRDIDDDGRKWSLKNYLGGYTSYGSMSELHRFSTTFEQLKTHIDKHVHAFVKQSEMDINKGSLQMTSLWVNIMSKGAKHTMHLHPLSVISGTYYLKIPAGAPGIKFEDPRLAAFMASPPRKSRAKTPNQRFVTLTPKPGDVVLFESWLKHEVPSQAGSSDRVSLSFNYDWVK